MVQKNMEKGFQGKTGKGKDSFSEGKKDKQFEHRGIIEFKSTE